MQKSTAKQSKKKTGVEKGTTAAVKKSAAKKKDSLKTFRQEGIRPCNCGIAGEGQNDQSVFGIRL